MKNRRLSFAAVATLTAAAFFASGCSTFNFPPPLSPEKKSEILSRVETITGAAIQGAFDAVNADAASQLAAGTKIDKINASSFAGAAIVGGLGSAIRAAVSTRPAALAESASNYTPTPGTPPPLVIAVAPTISAAIDDAVRAGVPKKEAQESAAKGADAVAKSIGQP